MMFLGITFPICVLQCMIGYEQISARRVKFVALLNRYSFVFTYLWNYLPFISWSVGNTIHIVASPYNPMFFIVFVPMDHICIHCTECPKINVSIENLILTYSLLKFTVLKISLDSVDL